MLSKNQLVKVRNLIEKNYRGKCTIIEKQKITKADHSTGFSDVTICENAPCKISFENITSSNETDSVNSISQIIKLFISPDLTIKPGSQVIVNQDNLHFTYQSTGIPAVYPTHQEILLKSDKERA